MAGDDAGVRRRFYELAAVDAAPIATEALARIAALYAIEADIKGAHADHRRTIRQDRSRPIVDALEPWLRGKLTTISQKTKLAEAIRYALSRWKGLTLFIDDGRVEIDNNVVERAIRPIALNRKNALFAGSDGGAEHWATIASLVGTCKLNGVDPQIYLADVITRIVNGHPKPYRRAPSLGLRRHVNAQSRGLKTPLTIVLEQADLLLSQDATALHRRDSPSLWKGTVALTIDSRPSASTSWVESVPVQPPST